MPLRSCYRNVALAAPLRSLCSHFAAERGKKMAISQGPFYSIVRCALALDERGYIHRNTAYGAQ